MEIWLTKFKYSKILKRINHVRVVATVKTYTNAFNLSLKSISSIITSPFATTCSGCSNQTKLQAIKLNQLFSPTILGYDHCLQPTLEGYLTLQPIFISNQESTNSHKVLILGSCTPLGLSIQLSTASTQSNQHHKQLILSNYSGTNYSTQKMTTLTHTWLLVKLNSNNTTPNHTQVVFHSIGHSVSLTSHSKLLFNITASPVQKRETRLINILKDTKHYKSCYIYRSFETQKHLTCPKAKLHIGQIHVSHFPIKHPNRRLSESVVFPMGSVLVRFYCELSSSKLPCLICCSILTCFRPASLITLNNIVLVKFLAHHANRTNYRKITVDNKGVEDPLPQPQW